MAEVEQPADRDIPPWVAVGLLAILLAGGGAFVWWQLSGYWAGDTVVIDAAAATVGRGPQRPAGALRPQARSGPAARPAARAVVARPPASRPVDGVRAMQPNVWLIRSGQATVQVRKRGAEPGLHPALSWPRSGLTRRPRRHHGPRPASARSGAGRSAGRYR